MTSAEFFAGIGGFATAFWRADIKTVVQIEYDSDCLELLASKHPGAERISNVLGINQIHRRMRLGLPILNYEKWKRLFELLARSDVFCGGFPCQDLSVAGARAGLAGERSGLWFAFRRIIALFRPAWVVIENVPGMLSSNGGADLGVIFSGLEKLGYRWAYRTLDAQYTGLAQRRERVFIVAHRPHGKRSVGASEVLDEAGILRLVAEVLFEPESLCWDNPPSREAGQKVAAPIAGVSNGGGANGPGRTADDAECLIPETSHAVACMTGGVDREDRHTLIPEPAFVMAHGQVNAEIRRDGSPSLTCNHEAPIIAFGSKDSGHDAQEDLSPTLRSMNFKDSHLNGGGQVAIAFKPSHFTRGKDGAPSEVVPPLSADADKGDQEAVIAFEPRYFTRDNKTGGAPSETVDITNCKKAGDSAPVLAFQTRIARNGRGQPEEIAPALNGANAGATSDMRPCLASAGGVRRLTPVECERLQGFNDDYTADFSDSVRYRMLGNAVAVNVVEWIAHRLARAIQKSKPVDVLPSAG